MIVKSVFRNFINNKIQQNHRNVSKIFVHFKNLSNN